MLSPLNIVSIISTLLTFSLANIDFTWVQPTCNTDAAYKGCLRGQACVNNACRPTYEASSFLERRPEKRQISGVPRMDGRCGYDFSNAFCDPAGAFGGCCSRYGWCGSSSLHCSSAEGCQSGCSPISPNLSTLTTVSSVVAGAPVTKNQASDRPGVTTDGTCGSQNNERTCVNWPQGSCCSQYGWCGSSINHCGTGCQSGSCLETGPSNSAAESLQPRASSAAESAAVSLAFTAAAARATGGPITNDGTCGAANGNSVCGNWPRGSCCSMYGFCGNTEAHCGAGCQSGPCFNAPVAAAPGSKPAPMNANPGSFRVVGQSGVPAMHAGLLPNGRVVFLDKVENYTQLRLADGYYAYSSEYNPEDNTVVPLAYKTNAFCSGGIFLADGSFLDVGGNAPLDFIDPTVGDGFTALRYLKRSSSDASLNGKPWNEPGNRIASNRWYASVQVLPDGAQFVASGSLNGLDPTVPANNNPTYEVLNRQGVSNGVNIQMDLLVKAQPYYMYPFIHLLPDGNLFVFAAKFSQNFNVGSNTVLRSFADLPGDFRSYPNTGGSVLLPLSSATNYSAEVVICGGGPYQDITAPTDASCGRIRPLDTNAAWEMDAMPEGRCMVEGILLLDGTVLWINGANRGAQGFGEATDPAYEALIYDPNAPLGQRWTSGASSTIARLYHSVALLLLDGTVMIAGSNPAEQPILQASAQNPYVTEFRVEIYTPPYLSKGKPRPVGVTLSTLTITPGGSNLTITFTAPTSATASNTKVVLYYGGFVTHSVHMGHRMIYLDHNGFVAGQSRQSLTIRPPPNSNIAPPGPYVVYVVVDGVPAVGQFVTVA